MYALSVAGPERGRLRAIFASEAVVEISAVAWYESCRGPRTPEQIAVARSFVGERGVLPLDEHTATASAEEFRLLGPPRKRAADIGIGVTARGRQAILLTRNARDFHDLDGLRCETA